MFKYKYHLLALLAGASYSGLAIFSGLLTQQGLDLFNQVFWRLTLSIILAFLIGKVGFKVDLHLTAKEIKYLFINSLVILFAVVTFPAAIYLGTPLAKTVVLTYSYPLTIVVLSYLLFRSLPTKKNWLAIVLSVVSLGLLFEVWNIKEFSQIGKGDLVAFANSFFFAGMIVWGSKIRHDTELHPYKIVFYSFLFIIPMLVAFSLGLQRLGVMLFLPVVKLDLTAANWATLGGLALFGSVLPISLIYVVGNKLKPFITSVLLLTEPVWVYIFGLAYFHQQLSGWAILGAVGILISVLLTD